jgi:hypothetical protein
VTAVAELTSGPSWFTMNGQRNKQLLFKLKNGPAGSVLKKKSGLVRSYG